MNAYSCAHAAPVRTLPSAARAVNGTDNTTRTPVARWYVPRRRRSLSSPKSEDGSAGEWATSGEGDAAPGCAINSCIAQIEPPRAFLWAG